MSDFQIDPNKVLHFFDTHADEPVGITGVGAQCPLANYLKQYGIEHPIVGGYNITVTLDTPVLQENPYYCSCGLCTAPPFEYINEFEFDAPEWVEIFVRHVDGMTEETAPSAEVSGARAAEILRDVLANYVA